jgi:hypothetical protein
MTQVDCGRRSYRALRSSVALLQRRHRRGGPCPGTVASHHRDRRPLFETASAPLVSSAVPISASVSGISRYQWDLGRRPGGDRADDEPQLCIPRDLLRHADMGYGSVRLGTGRSRSLPMILVWQRRAIGGTRRPRYISARPSTKSRVCACLGADRNGQPYARTRLESTRVTARSSVK